MSNRSYIYTIMVVIVCFCMFHLCAWLTLTKDILSVNPDFQVGDLARMSYIHDLTMKYKKNGRSSGDEFRYYPGIGKVDMITLGDSFSNGMSKSTNNYYQSQIAKRYNMKVLNIHYLGVHGFIEALVLLLNSSYIDELQPEYLLLQSVERMVFDRFSKQIDWDQSLGDDFVLDKILERKYINEPPEVYFINSGNYDALIYNLLY